MGENEEIRAEITPAAGSAEPARAHFSESFGATMARASSNFSRDRDYYSSFSDTLDNTPIASPWPGSTPRMSVSGGMSPRVGGGIAGASGSPARTRTTSLCAQRISSYYARPFCDLIYLVILNHSSIVMRHSRRPRPTRCTDLGEARIVAQVSRFSCLATSRRRGSNDCAQSRRHRARLFRVCRPNHARATELGARARARL